MSEYRYLTAREFEEALAGAAHAMAEVETVQRGHETEIALIHLLLSDGRHLIIASVSGADLAIEERP